MHDVFDVASFNSWRPRECVSKFAQFGVEETAIFTETAKPYFAAEVQRSREEEA
jgi:hypothetical protein